MIPEYQWALISVEVFLALSGPRHGYQERLANILQMYGTLTGLPAGHNCCGGRVPEL